MSKSATINSSLISVLPVYLLLLIAAIGIFWGICQFRERLPVPIASGDVVATVQHSRHVNVAAHVLTALTAVIALGNLLSWLLRRFGQPAVIGEVIAGILLGPSVLGAVSPAAMHWLIPGPETDPQQLVVTAMNAIAQLGIVLYMFIVGLELNLEKVGRNAHIAVAISHAGIVLPFVLGGGLALWLYPALSGGDVPFTSFALFLAVAMSITAFPVLAHILTDRGLDQSELGVIALSCMRPTTSRRGGCSRSSWESPRRMLGDAVTVAAATILFLGVMIGVVQPLIRHWIDRTTYRKSELRAAPLVLIGLLAAALATELIGIHAVFGAFLFGAMIPHDSVLAKSLTIQLRMVVTALFLPAFFAITGMNTQIGLITGMEHWLMLGAIILVATVGKLGGTLVASRAVGLDWRTATALGILMNTRGLMELIVLNVGLALKIISPELFAMMVLMALATTVATAPILRLLVPDQPPIATRQVDARLLALTHVRPSHTSPATPGTGRQHRPTP